MNDKLHSKLLFAICILLVNQAKLNAIQDLQIYRNDMTRCIERDPGMMILCQEWRITWYFLLYNNVHIFKCE